MFLYAPTIFSCHHNESISNLREKNPLGEKLTFCTAKASMPLHKLNLFKNSNIPLLCMDHWPDAIQMCSVYDILQSSPGLRGKQTIPICETREMKLEK